MSLVMPELQDWATWRQSQFVDAGTGHWQTVMRCPTCGAIVGDPHLHAGWHLKEGK